MISKGISKIGLVRKRNEDRFYTNDTFSIVADGMGGYAGGEKASTLAIDTMRRMLMNTKEQNYVMAESILQEGVRLANEEIYKEATSHEDLKGMGTTLVIAYVEENRLYWANVGDSRLYVFRDGVLHKITKDHSMVQELYATSLSEKELMLHPQRNVLTRAVGVQSSVEVDTGVWDIEKGDRILLCSDGLSGYIDTEVIEQAFQNEENCERLLEDLIDLVFDAGAKDNVTIVVGTI